MSQSAPLDGVASLVKDSAIHCETRLARRADKLTEPCHMDSALVSLFIGSLLASTLVPGGVEGLLLLMVQQQNHSLESLFVVATIGNTLGGIITFGVGVLIARGVQAGGRDSRLARWFRLEGTALTRVRNYGTPVLLLSWMPVIGDPLCLAGGFIGLRLWPSVLMIFLGKAARYLVLLWLLEKTV